MNEQVTESSRHSTASAVVIDSELRMTLLVAHRANGTWQLPGGHVDPDEAPHEAAVREVFEETGVRVYRVLSAVALPRVPGSELHPVPLQVAERAAPAKPHLGEPTHRHIDHLYAMLADSTAPLTHQAEENDGARWVPIMAVLRRSVREDVPAQLAAAVMLERAYTEAARRRNELEESR